MRVSEGRLGRVFLLRLDDGDAIPDAIEGFAAREGVAAAQVVLLGAAASGKLVAGPRDAAVGPAEPMLLPVDGVHEVLGVGLLAPDEAGMPRLHIHGVLGRGEVALAGCMRYGVNAWCMIEAVVTEILSTGARRVLDTELAVSVLDLNS